MTMKPCVDLLEYGLDYRTTKLPNSLPFLFFFKTVPLTPHDHGCGQLLKPICDDPGAPPFHKLAAGLFLSGCGFLFHFFFGINFFLNYLLI